MADIPGSSQLPHERRLVLFFCEYTPGGGRVQNIRILLRNA